MQSDVVCNPLLVCYAEAINRRPRNTGTWAPARSYWHCGVRSRKEHKVMERAQSHVICTNRHFASAYRANHSCEDLLAICINDWQRALDRGHFVAIALLDLSKAFDSVPHDKLLLELQACGIGGNALKWFHSYLTDRSQVVKVPQQPIGPSYPCTQGVPQGSVLGPLLFTAYVRMLPFVVINSRNPLFADDINLYNNGPDLPVGSRSNALLWPNIVHTYMYFCTALNMGNGYVLWFHNVCLVYMCLYGVSFSWLQVSLNPIPKAVQAS